MEFKILPKLLLLQFRSVDFGKCLFAGATLRPRGLKLYHAS